MESRRISYAEIQHRYPASISGFYLFAQKASPNQLSNRGGSSYFLRHGDIPPCLVTFPRCLIAKTCASHRCTLISLKCLIAGDIAVQQIEKHYIAVEVNAIQFFPIIALQSNRRFALSVLYNNLELYFALLLVLQSPFPVFGMCGFFVKTNCTPFFDSKLHCTPQAIPMSTCEDETSLWWS